jgi:hypothetical protein
LQRRSEITLDEILKTNIVAYDNFIKNGVVDYGYIIYSKGMPYLMDSNLYQHVRHMYYDCPVPGSRRDRRRGNHSDVSMYPIDRQKFCTLHATLSHRHSPMLLKLFPQFEHDVDNIKAELATMHKSLVESYRKYIGCNVETMPITKRCGISGPRKKQFYDQVRVDKKYQPIWELMIKKLPKTVSNNNIVEMISLFIANENNAPLIYSIMYDK